MSNEPTEHLHEPESGYPGVSAAMMVHYAEAAGACFEHNDHAKGVGVQLEGLLCGKTSIAWPGITDQVRRAHADLQVATELGACSVAFKFVTKATGLTIAERSCKGTGFDYWLTVDEDDALFQNKARLEVSGILRESPTNTVETRVKQKLSQTNASDDSGLPAYVVVAEFGIPKAKVVQK